MGKPYPELSLYFILRNRVLQKSRRFRSTIPGGIDPLEFTESENSCCTIPLRLLYLLCLALFLLYVCLEGGSSLLSKCFLNLGTLYTTIPVKHSLPPPPTSYKNERYMKDTGKRKVLFFCFYTFKGIVSRDKFYFRRS
jgi:hypothetical protein